MVEMKHEIPVQISPALVGVAVSSDATNLLFYAPKAFPPGQPIDVTFWPDTDQAFTVQARSIGSRLCEDQRFEVRTRLVNLSREKRTKLLDAFGQT